MVTADACLMCLCKDVVYPRFKPARNVLSLFNSMERFEWRFFVSVERQKNRWEVTYS
uniref:Uncharacterized protein n=1 Tax=Anguilla anguilla TaxID=7936 RepID=A0A0E9URD8_ANGAN